LSFDIFISLYFLHGKLFHCEALGGTVMKKLKELTFSPEAEEMAIKYAAFDIMKQLNKEGKITDEELRYIAKKRDLSIE
jgi:hypothetical protein